MKTYTSLSSYAIHGKKCFAVRNPSQCEDFAHLIGHAEIDGVRHSVVAVERFAHMPPFREGEPIGLLTDTPA